MRYRTKILIALTLLALVCGGAVMGLYYHHARNLLHEQIRTRALAATTTAALALDGDLHREAIRDPDGPAFARMENQLRTLRDANRLPEHYIRYLYTLLPDGEGGWTFFFDAEEDPELKSLPGDPLEYEGGGDVTLSLTQPVVEAEYSTDVYGTWLSAYAPILDRSGQAVALLGADFEAARVNHQLQRLLWVGLIALGIAAAAALVLAFFVSRWATEPLAVIERAVRSIGAGNLQTSLPVRGTDEFASLAAAVNQMAAALRDRENLKKALTRYVSQDVADRIVSENSMPSLQGEKRRITVMMIDIRNFSGLSEQLGTEEVVAFLNAYFGELIEVIFRNHGTLDKFLGDGLMVVFGAPLPDPDHAWSATQAALEVLDCVAEMSARYEREKGFTVRVGIGLHTGEAIVGNIGSEQRMEYTAIGAAVNLAFRMEALTKQFKVPVVMGATVFESIRDRIASVSLGEATVNGKPMEVFTLQRFVEG